jgi:hypothetical protein
MYDIQLLYPPLFPEKSPKKFNQDGIIVVLDPIQAPEYHDTMVLLLLTVQTCFVFKIPALLNGNS